MLEINLLPVREARRRAGLRQQVVELMGALFITMGIIYFVHDGLSSKVELAKVRVQQMDNDIKQFKPQLDQVASFRKKKGQLEKKIDIIEGLDRARSGPVRVLSELASRTPHRLWLKTVDAKGTTLTMKGQSLDNELVALFLRGLDESPYFTNVDLDGTKLKTQGDLRVVEFGIRATVVNKAPEKQS